MRASIRRAAFFLTLLCASSCATLDVEPTDARSGTFRTTALSFTFMGNDYPQSAILLARANAADSQLANPEITREFIFPYLWRMDFLLDIVSVRWATVSGTYGPD